MNSATFDERVRVSGPSNPVDGPIAYWMSRDQRTRDNWALVHAQKLAVRHKQALIVVFCLSPVFLEATAGHYSFMLNGLRPVSESLEKLNIPFFLMKGEPDEQLARFASRNHLGALVTDFSPLRINRKWKTKLSDKIKIPLHIVDAHNIVPCWVTSDKMEFAARTIRPKINRLLPSYLTEIPRIKRHKIPWKGRHPAIRWSTLMKSIKAADTGQTVKFKPGEKEAQRTLRSFLADRLVRFDAERNNPLAGAASDLSPYLHFGHISAQRVALQVRDHQPEGPESEAFLEQLIVRRELSDNYCYYNDDYDSFDGFPAWAQETLDIHRRDRRQYIYSVEEFESARTHDDLWNAAQMEMVLTGKMHGYLRMYWAKKILEWTSSPEEAQRVAVYLNDRYELDGRDPNGYAGVAWAVGGVHDRPWPERKVFGKIRYMNYEGCRRKFDVAAYIDHVDNLRADAES